MQVLLVVVFGIVERFRGSDFRRDLTFITGRLHRFHGNASGWRGPRPPALG